MLNYQALKTHEGGPWIGPLAFPKLKTGSMVETRAILSGLQKQRDNIALTGGDPLSHPDILEILNAITMYDYTRVMIRTTAESLADLDFVRDIILRGAYMFEVVPSVENMKAIRYLKNIYRITERYERLKVSYFAAVIAVDGSSYGNLQAIVESVLGSVNVSRVIFCWGDPSFNIWLAGDQLKLALYHCIRKKVWAFTRGIPACVVPDNLYQLEELFTASYGDMAVDLPESCGSCEFRKMCGYLPRIDDQYSWQPKPQHDHRHSDYIIDILKNGPAFNKENMKLYSNE